MRWVTVQTEHGPRACGDWHGEYVDVNAADPASPSTIRELLALGETWMRRAWERLQHGPVRHDPTSVRLLAPVPDARKVLCIGLNYLDHARESNMDPPSEPILFGKYPNALLGHGGTVLAPRESQQVDFEAELVVVIGRGGRRIPRAEAMRHVGGYAIGNDVSARDWQLGRPGKQWTIGKTFDTFAPVGPAVVTPDEVPDPHRLGIRLRLNGQTMQDSNTSQLIFGVDALIAHLSTVMTLGPGDLIFTGTPPGVGMARRPPVWLQPGDVVEVEIDGLGVLRNPVASD